MAKKTNLERRMELIRRHQLDIPFGDLFGPHGDQGGYSERWQLYHKESPDAVERLMLRTRKRNPWEET